MIILSDIVPFAEGGNRKCFVHPDNPNRCLKVVHPGLLEKIKKNKPWYKRVRSLESFDDNLREENAYQQKAIINGDSNIWDHLAKWYGMKETDIGMASETELIRNDGEIADTLESYLFKKGMTNEIKNSIAAFQEWLRESLVLTKNLIPHNLVIKKENDEMLLRLLMVLAHKHLFPFQAIQIFLLRDMWKEELS